MKSLLYRWSVPILLLIISLYLYEKPAYNWDMFPYMVLTAAQPSVSLDSTYAFVYHEAARVMQDNDFSAVTRNHGERMSNATSFIGILKYYELKPGYITTTRALHGMGLGLLPATYLPSLISYFLIGCLLWWWASNKFGYLIAMIIAAMIAFSPFLLLTARYSSPDMLCALLLFGGVFLLSEGSLLWGLMLCGLSISVRPDSVLLFLLILLATTISKKLSFMYCLAIASTGIALSLWIVGIDLLKEFLFTVPAYSKEWSTGELVSNYIHGLRAGIYSIVNSQTWVILLLGSLGLYIQKQRGFSLFRDYWCLLILASIIAIALRYLLHPVLEDRFLIASYLIVLMGFCHALAAILLPKTSSEFTVKNLP